MKKKRERYLPESRKIHLQIRKMKLTLILTLLVFVTFGNSFSQVKLSLNLKKATIQEVLKTIEDQSDYIFLYKDEIFDQKQHYSIDFEETSFEEVLNSICETAKVDYEIRNGRQIILKEKPRQTYLEIDDQQKEITGVIVDKQGAPLPGVSIVVTGTSTGTVTGIDGRFSLSIPNNAETLQFSFVGMRMQELPLEGRTTFSIVMEEETIGIDEVVAIGYGTMKKTDLTGSVASVNSKDFIKGVATDALQLISGKASGVNISQVNSEPGGQIVARVRGAGSINSSNSVLIVIDGLPGGNTANINPSDIESIEILKDASAAAIYGTRAANGVILITTKKGKDGTPEVSYNTYWAYQTPSYKFNVLDATNYMQMINDISKDAGKTIPYTQDQISAAGKGTDWQDELFTNAWANNHQFSVNGGNKQSKYYASLGYMNQDGILVRSGFKKYNALVNLETNPSDKFRFGINLNANLNFKDKIANESNHGGENADPLNSALMFDPRLSPKKNENGEYEKNPSIALDNPVALAYGYDYRDQNNRIYGTTFGEYHITNDLKATVRLGGNINNTRNDEYQDRTTQRGKASGGIGNVYSTNMVYWLAEGLINYNRTFGVHRISLLGGST